ncbi:thiamine phosphate synthase [Chitinophagaceae bacterium MMS25-I14]
MISILLTPETDHPDEAEIISQCLQNGLDRLHLRKPGYTQADYDRYIRHIDKNYHSRIVLHNAFDLVNEYHLGGIHMNADIRQNPSMITHICSLAPVPLSASFHTWEEIENDEMSYQYVFISPVFQSISKKDYGPNIDLAGAAAFKAKTEAQNRYCPSIVGLGGVGAENIMQLKDNDFDGAALLGAVWLAADPVKAFTDIIAALQGH